MLNFIKKHKLILILLIFTLFLFINTKVNADSNSIEYNGITINTTYFNNNQNSFLMYDKNTNTYLDFELFRTTNGVGSNPRFYIVKEDENYIYISGRSDQYFYNCTAVYNYNTSSGSRGSVVSSDNYAGSTTGSNSNNGSYKIDKNRYYFIYKGDNTKIYTDQTCITENTTSEFFYGKFKLEYSIELSTAEESLEPIYAYSNYFDISTLNRYEVYISLDNIDYKKMNIETMNHLDGTCEYRYNYKIFSNGTYYFKFVDNETNEETIITYEITNILSNSTNFGFTIDGIPQPFVTYSRIVDKFILQTQSFTYEDFEKLECYYTTDPNLDYSSWDKMSLGTLNNTITGTVEYYFFFSVPQYSEDTTYYFVFYDTTLQKYGYKSSLNCIFDKMNEYEDNVSGVVDEKNSKFNELIQFFNNRLGFLTYPFEFIINLLNKILTINYEEPVLRFPQITNPLDDTVIFEGFDFNFNSILEYKGISYFYNIYLIAVDFILVVAFIKGCKHIIEGVFGNG